MARISRRGLLLGGVAVAAVPTAFIASTAMASRADTAAGYIRHALPGLAVPKAELTGFAEEYVSRIDRHNRRKSYYDLIFFLMANPDAEGMLPARLLHAYQGATRYLLTTFLLSTDFFSAAGQRPELTNFIAYADPFELGCRNPLARFDD
jgi:hypothetical protein